MQLSRLPRVKQSHELDYEILGDDIQTVEVELDPGETVIAEAGAMNCMEEGTGFEAKMGDGSEPDQGFFRVCRFQDWPTVSWLMHPRPEGRGRESDPCSADSVICSTGIDASATSGSSNPDGEIDRERGTLSGG